MRDGRDRRTKSAVAEKALDIEPDEQTRKLYQGLSEGEVK